MSKSRRKQHVLELKVFDFQCDMYRYYDTVVCTIPYYGEIKVLVAQVSHGEIFIITELRFKWLHFYYTLYLGCIRY